MLLQLPCRALHVVSYSGEDDVTICPPDEIEITTSNEDIIYLSGSTSDISEIDSAIETRNYIDISDSDIELIAKLLWFEARGECDDCKRRVVSVVITHNDLIYINIASKYFYSLAVSLQVDL